MKLGTLKLRIKLEDRNLIDRAATARGKDRATFVLDAARAAAEQVLLDQTVFRVNPEVFAAFVARLDAPARPNEGLCKLMRAPTHCR